MMHHSRDPFAPIPTDDSAELRVSEREQAEALLGLTLGGKYQLLSIIGSGGFASVFEANHLALGRHMAVKVLHRRFVRDQRFREQFELEAMSVASLNHPNIVGVVDFGIEPDGMAYLVFELVRGRSMRALADGLPNRPEDAISVCIQVLAALEEAHAQGVVHRDLKPENVLLQSAHGMGETVKLIDFGIAALDSNPDSGLFRRGESTVCGTPEYMSPEQATGLDVSAASDIYSVGVMLYELLTGTLPYDMPTRLETMHAHVKSPVPKISARHGKNLELFDGVIAKAMAKRARDRYTCASAFRRDLQKLHRRLRPRDLSQIQPGALGLDHVSVAMASMNTAIPTIPAGPMPATRPEVRIAPDVRTFPTFMRRKQTRRRNLAGGFGAVAALAFGGLLMGGWAGAPGDASAHQLERQARFAAASMFGLDDQAREQATAKAVAAWTYEDTEAAENDEPDGDDDESGNGDLGEEGTRIEAELLFEEAQDAYRHGRFTAAYKAARQSYAAEHSLRALNLMRDAACTAGHERRARYTLRYFPQSAESRFYDRCAAKGLDLRSVVAKGPARALPGVDDDLQ